MTAYAYTKPEIDWSTFPDGDGEPVAENHENLVQMIDLIFALRRLFEVQGRTRVVVGGNQLLYYNRLNGREHVSPDVYAVFDIPPPAPRKWQTWVQGKSPDIVWEISSESTQDEDTGTKRDIYARIGVREYYIFDPLGGLQPSFQAYTLRDTGLERVPLLPSGGIASPLLAAELRPMAMAATSLRRAATYLRVIDPLTGDPIPVPEQAYQGFDEVSRAYAKAQLDIFAAEGRAEAEARRAEAEARARQEAQRRAEVEAQRAAQLEAELRAALARLHDDHRDAIPTDRDA